MMAKPIRTLELQYQQIQFLIKGVMRGRGRAVALRIKNNCFFDVVVVALAPNELGS